MEVETIGIEMRSDAPVLINAPQSSPAFTLTWCNLSVWIKQKKTDESKSYWKRTHWEDQRILTNVNGICKSGSLMAIMGASGGGKTTLLATLSQRMKVGVTEGNILINGRTVNPELMNKISGFVPQHDLVFASLTVYEHMSFMAALKMDRRTKPRSRCHRINELLLELGMNKCKHSPLSTLSGGEMKRVSLAVELLTDPPLLFCDEPTTGLDSYNAKSVIENLKLCAERGKTVICTIHQPASSIFDMFSRVLLLAGGRVAYQGDAVGAASHFNDLGLICPTTYNKAEYYIAQLAVVPGKEDASCRKIERICDMFNTSKYGVTLTEELTMHEGRRSSILTVSNTHGNTSLEDDYFTKYLTLLKVKHLTQLTWLTWRSFVDVFRNTANYITRFILFLFIALLISVPYSNFVVDQKGIQNLQGLMYLVITETMFTYAYSVLHTFSHEMPILLREIGGGLYKPGPYYISKMIVLLPQAIIEPFIYTLLVYYIAELHGGFVGLLVFSVPVIGSAITATAYGCMISALFDSVPTATLLSVPIEFLIISMSGLFIQLQTLPAFLSWLPYVSQLFYGIEAVSIHQWTQIGHIDCSPDPTLPCMSSGEVVLQKYGYHINNFSWDILGLFAIYCVAHLLGFLAIWHRSKKQPVY